MTYTRKKVGVIGAGQLARMMQPEAVELNIDFSLLAESEAGCAVPIFSQYSVGDYTDVDAVRSFAENLDVITFDHEHVPLEVMEAIKGVDFHPQPHALMFAKDKIMMRRAMEKHGFPCPRWAVVDSVNAIVAFKEQLDAPVVVKTPQGGYDGKGVKFVSHLEDAKECEAWFSQFDELLVEEAVSFTAELSAMSARNTQGEVASWDVVETIQEDGVCSVVIAPAQNIPAEVLQRAQQVSQNIGETLDITGVYAVEMFYVPDSEQGFYINELAMRPHNSGHWTQNGAKTSQFEQHLRAVSGLPLGSPQRMQEVAVMKNILGGPASDIAENMHDAMHNPDIKVHLYGKESRPGRKIGHINVTGKNAEQLLQKAQTAHDILQKKNTTQEK